jgi:hypothetical protein
MDCIARAHTSSFKGPPHLPTLEPSRLGGGQDIVQSQGRCCASGEGSATLPRSHSAKLRPLGRVVDTPQVVDLQCTYGVIISTLPRCHRILFPPPIACAARTGAQHTDLSFTTTFLVPAEQGRGGLRRRHARVRRMARTGLASKPTSFSGSAISSYTPRGRSPAPTLRGSPGRAPGRRGGRAGPLT